MRGLRSFLVMLVALVAIGGYANAGQVCISVQRVIAHPAVSGDFLDALVPKVEAIRVGDPSSPETGMGTLITTGEAERVRQSIAAAAASGWPSGPPTCWPTPEHGSSPAENETAAWCCPLWSPM